VERRRIATTPRRFSETLRQAAVRYLAVRDRTGSQLRMYLERLGATPAQADRIIKQFSVLGYIDDEAYARRWAEKRLRQRPMGCARLEAELHARGIDLATAGRIVTELYRDLDELSLARWWLRRKSATPALLRRYGFSEETIEACFETRDEER
jgi:SOS response regulatory protein OraA/RecX